MTKILMEGIEGLMETSVIWSEHALCLKADLFRL
jgi:hypothetical protein